MSEFPRTQIEDLSVSRMIMGTNWFLGFSHTSKAKDDFIKQRQTRAEIARVVTAFMSEGVDTMLGGRPGAAHLLEAIADAEQATGRECIMIGSPGLDLSETPEAADANARTLDEFAACGVKVCCPHQATTDRLLDIRRMVIHEMDQICEMIRHRGMIPGLSTHRPETVRVADQTDLDVATYIQIYNAAGFMMPLEVDWHHRIIQNAAKPVLTIKPLAAGRLLPLVGLAFSWSTIRDQDMVAIGCLTADEASEVIEISRSLLENRTSRVELQTTRSKQGL
jgi:hypothetical protein